MQHIEGAVNRVPVLEKTGIKSTVCGPGNVTVVTTVVITVVALWCLGFSESIAEGKGKLYSLGRRKTP